VDVDEGGWIDLNERLGASGLPEGEVERLIDALASRLVGHFGAETIECHLGKNDPTAHSMREVAAAALAHLSDAIDPARTDAIQGQAPPWDDRWRTDERTAGMRS
jgi:hypothetical protein